MEEIALTYKITISWCFVTESRLLTPHHRVGIAQITPCFKRALCLVLGVGALVVAGTSSLQTAQANGDTRSLRMYHSHSHESISITFKRDGRFDDAALKKINWFLRDWRRDEATQMDARLFDLVWEVYRDVGGQEPVTIVSAYRSPATNAMLRARSRGVAKFSQHMMGKAMDFYIPGVPLARAREAGMKKQRGGVGFYPSSGSPFIHLDVGSVRAWPRMTRDQLARVFPDGNTIHLPADGKPLSGYYQTLARIGKDGKSGGGMMAYAPSNEDNTNGGRGLLALIFGKGGASSDEEGDEAETVTVPARTKTPPQKAPVVVAAASPPTPPPPAQEASDEAPEPVAKPALSAQLPLMVSAASAPMPLPKPVLLAAITPTLPIAAPDAPVPVAKPLLTAALPVAAPLASAPIPLEKPVLNTASLAVDEKVATADLTAKAPMPLANPRRNPALATTLAAAGASPVRPAKAVLTALHYDAAHVKPFVARQPAAAAPVLTQLGATDKRHMAEFVTTTTVHSTLFSARPKTTDSFTGSAVRARRS